VTDVNRSLEEAVQEFGHFSFLGTAITPLPLPKHINRGRTVKDCYIKALEALKLQAKALSGNDDFMIDQELLERSQLEMEKNEPYTSQILTRMMETTGNNVTIDTINVNWLQQEFKL
jgi:hypothetical protein